MNFTSLGALLGFLAVALGAFGAHALRAQLAPPALAAFETGVRYQFLHALALLFVGTQARHAPRAGATPAGGLFVAGTLLFSGSLYALALTGENRWGVVTPLGGLCFLAGWVALAYAYWGRTR